MSAGNTPIGPTDAKFAAAVAPMPSDSSSAAGLEFFGCASAEDARVFKRVPYEKRTHWLLLWNKTNDASAVSCMQAFNTLAYAATVTALLRGLYNDGAVTGVKTALKEFNVCLDVVGLRNKKPEAAQELLHRYVAEQEHEAPHVYTFRREPKFFKLLEFSRIDVTGETKAAVEGAAAAKAAADDAAAAAAAAAPAKAVAGRSWWWPFG